jgi:hypothetical protein
MTKEIELLKQQIQMLQSKLSFLEEIEKHNAKLKMTLENEGEFSIVSYDGRIYYRLEFPTAILWFIKQGNLLSDTILKCVDDLETHRLLENAWNYEVNPKDTEPYCPDEPEENEWRTAALRFGETLSSIGPYGYYDMSADEWLKWAIDTYEKLSSDLLQILNRERNKTNLYKNKNTKPYCPDEPLEYDEIEHDISENVENKTIRDVIDRWWMNTFTSKNMSSVNECIDDLADQVEFWILRNKK